MLPPTTAPVPHLRKAGNSWEIVVDNAPYLILGAELQNSSMSSARHMDSVWPKLKHMNINTILGNVAWEDIEVEDGKFDFSELDKIIATARSFGFRLILLWFGSFKNALSSYVPGWIKTNPKRFPRMHIRQANGSVVPCDTLSILHEECLRADARALTQLMQHLAESDSYRTVIMLQIQNEVGLLGDSRDRSSSANQAFHGTVPAELIEFLTSHPKSLHPDLKKNLTTFFEQSRQGTTKSCSWEKCFGRSVYTDELFMAYHYALYVDAIAAAGRATYGIPLFTNAWLPKPSTGGGLGNLIAAGGNLPGEYPSGGPTPNVVDIWFKFATNLDFIAPDIYSADYTKTCRAYRSGGRPLFIPEQRRDEYGARRLWEAIGTHLALGACPFGIDTLSVEDFPYTKHYRLLQSLRGLILQARQKGLHSWGFYFDDPDKLGADPEPPLQHSFEGFDLFLSRAFVLGTPGPGYGMIVELEPAKYLLIGSGFKVEFKSTSPTSALTGILRFEEKSVVDAVEGTLRTERVLNGDETRSGKWANMPSENPTYGEGFIPLLIPAGTMIAEVEVYSLDKKDITN